MAELVKLLGLVKSNVDYRVITSAIYNLGALYCPQKCGFALTLAIRPRNVSATRPEICCLDRFRVVIAPRLYSRSRPNLHVYAHCTCIKAYSKCTILNILP